MRRLGWAWAAAIAWVLAGCGESRSTGAQAGVQSGCGNCHTGPGEAPPFRDQTGSTDPIRLTVGAHDTHLHGSPADVGTGARAPLSASISCSECHTVPRTVSDPGHLDDSPNDIKFGELARTGGATPTYVAQGCAATYCHGNFPGGNAANTPKWLGGAAAAECGSCHGVPPPSGQHAIHLGAVCTAGFCNGPAAPPPGTPLTCVSCHGDFLASTHVDGVKTLVVSAFNPAPPRFCTAACHDARVWGP